MTKLGDFSTHRNDNSTRCPRDHTAALEVGVSPVPAGICSISSCSWLCTWRHPTRRGRDGRSETRWNLAHPSRPSLTGSVSSTGCWIRFAISPPYRRQMTMSPYRRQIAVSSPCRHLAAISPPNRHQKLNSAIVRKRVNYKVKTAIVKTKSNKTSYEVNYSQLKSAIISKNQLKSDIAS